MIQSAPVYVDESLPQGCIQPLINRNLALVLIAIVTVILHGSLYPYAFHIRSGDPIATLIGTWATGPSGRGDFAANILLYVPFGLFAVLAINRRVPIWLVTLAGFAFCCTMELLQFYDQGRVTSASDVYLNTFGTWAGAMAGRVVRLKQPNWIRTEQLQAVPCLLLVAMLGYRLFPYVPTIDLHKYWNSLKPLIDRPTVDPYTAFRYFALWLTADYLVANVAKWQRPSWIPVALFAGFLFSAKVVIVDRSISPSELIAAPCAFALWVAIRERRWAALLVGSILCTAVTSERLEPFNFIASHQAFGWLPFRSFLGGSLSTNVQSMFEKIFLYGSLIWLTTISGARLSVATAAVAALLFLTSFAETYVTGRSAEITDMILALAMGAAISVLQSAGTGTLNATSEAAQPD